MNSDNLLPCSLSIKKYKQILSYCRIVTIGSNLVLVVVTVVVNRVKLHSAIKV